MNGKRRPIALDLFAGVGGMSLGFKQAGFNVVAAFDAEERHVDTYKVNFPRTKAFTIDLAEADGVELRRLAGVGRNPIDLVFGGPPCQGFSVGGRRDQCDPRNQLFLEFARLIVELKPRYFVAENVEGLMRGYGLEVVEQFCQTVTDAGFLVVRPIQVLDAADFGVPQRRRRTIILGHRKSLRPPTYPAKKGFIDENGHEYFPTVRDALADLPVVEKHSSLFDTDGYEGEFVSGSRYSQILKKELTHTASTREAIMANRGLTGCLRTRHSKETVKRFRETKPGKSEPISRYIRLTLDDVAPTLRAGTACDKGSHTAPRPIHPTKARCITVREAARLHSFPDWFQFHATRWHAFRQIGNSVPPLMAKIVARQLMTLTKTKRKS